MDEVQHKTRSLFQTAKDSFDDLSQKEIKETFKASNGWWHKYSKKYNLGSVKLLGEAASADHKAAAEFPVILKELIEKEGYLEDQIFNVDESGLWWKMPPTRTIKKKTGKQSAGLKLQKTRCTVLLGGNILD